MLHYNLFKLLSNYLILLIHLVNGQLYNNHSFYIYNNCQFDISIYSHENTIFNKKCSLNNSESCIKNYNLTNSGLIKTSLSETSTLFEYSITNNGIWYDISVIPPGSGNCYSYDECRIISNKSGYNIPLEIIVDNPTDKCTNLRCLSETCSDAYLFPFDNLKIKFCNPNTNFKLIYCPYEKNNTTLEVLNNKDIITGIQCNE